MPRASHEGERSGNPQPGRNLTIIKDIIKEILSHSTTSLHLGAVWALLSVPLRLRG